MKNLKTKAMLHIAGIIALMAMIVFSMTACGDGDPPNTPAGLSVSNESITSLRVNWSAVSDADGYKVYSSETADGNFDTYRGQFSYTARSGNITGLVPETTYYFKVLAFNRAGDSPLSEVVSGTTSAPPANPSPPMSLSAFAQSTTSIYVSCQMPSGNYHTEWQFEISAGSSGSWYGQVTKDTGNHTFTGLNPNSQYYFRVRARYKTGNWSGWTSGNTTATTPAQQ